MNCANHPDRERTAFCQSCGKPLCAECVRTIGSQIFCEPCFVARGSGVGVPPPGIYPPVPGAGPSPGLAALLGFIPGVGAMYNGQYAKGIVHLMVFAVLVSLAGENGVFGLFVAGWIFYMAIEAYHTARARRDGTPLPNPFGLNDLGERLGFGRSWPTSPAGAVPPVGAVPPTSVPPAGAGYGYTSAYAPPVSGWGAPEETYASYTPPGTVPSDVPVPPPVQPSRIPVGAIWLIGLGVIFLLGNTGLFWIRARFVGPVVLIGIGVWLFVRRMTESGLGIENDGTPQYAWRLTCAVRNSVWLVATGFLWLLDVLDVLPWNRSWPLFLIIGGVLLVLRRTVAPPAPYPYPGAGPYGTPPYGTPPTPPAGPAATTAIVPSTSSPTGKEVR